MKKFWDYFSGKSRTRSCTPGFSMMEILISCVIIGVLAVILIPTMQSAKPDKNEALHKKSTFVVERVINELSSDTQLYPNNGEYSSLSNTENVTYNNETHGGPTKFCTLFASRIKLKAGSEVSCIEGEKSFTSEDGIDWYLPVSDFKGGSETIMIDVNGSAGPNAIGEDRYEYKVQPGFKIPKKEIDEAITKILLSVDENERKELYNFVLTRLHEDAVYIPLTYECNKAVYTSDLKNVQFAQTQYEIPFWLMYFN